MTTLRHLNNTMLFDSFILFESFMVLAMTYSIRPHWKWNLVLAGCLGAMGMVWDFTSQTGEGLLGRGILIIACVMNVVLLALLWSVARESDRALHQVPQFWLFMGILLFYGGLIPVLAMVGFVFQVDQHLAYSLWSIPPVLGAVRYLFATHACVLERRLRQKAPNE
ncbi:MAG TPA: hypothetical protein PK760_02135 [Flavobacteriales bacterium]|nr:hypothetical protein [Flavobacteriales bacterium]